MKNLISLCTLAFIAYLFVRINLQNMVTLPSDFQFQGSFLQLKTALSDPPYYDKSPFCDTLEVIACGHLLWDLFGVNSFLAADYEGNIIRVFLDAQTAIPNRGKRLKVKGLFTVLANNSYIDNWCGVLASDMELLKRRKAGARQDDR